MPNKGVQINLKIPRTGSHYHFLGWQYNRRRGNCQKQSWKDGRIKPVLAGAAEMKTFGEILKEGGGHFEVYPSSALQLSISSSHWLIYRGAHDKGLLECVMMLLCVIQNTEREG